MSRKRLGELLIEAGVIDEHQLQSALGHQRQWGGRLGNLLVQLNLASEDGVVRALARQLNVGVADAPPDDLSPRVVMEISYELAKRHHVFPLAVKRDAKGEVIVLAMADPSNADAIDAMQFKTGKRVQPMLAGDSSITTWIQRHYEKRPQLSGMSATTAQSAASFNVQFGGQEVDFGAGGDAPLIQGGSLTPAPMVGAFSSPFGGNTGAVAAPLSPFSPFSPFSPGLTPRPIGSAADAALWERRVEPGPARPPPPAPLTFGSAGSFVGAETPAPAQPLAGFAVPMGFGSPPVPLPRVPVMDLDVGLFEPAPIGSAVALAGPAAAAAGVLPTIMLPELPLDSWGEATAAGDAAPIDESAAPDPFEGIDVDVDMDDDPVDAPASEAPLADAWADAAERPIPRKETDIRHSVDWVPASREIVVAAVEAEAAPEPVAAYKPAAPAAAPVLAPWAMFSSVAAATVEIRADPTLQTMLATTKPAPAAVAPSAEAPRPLEAAVWTGGALPPFPVAPPPLAAEISPPGDEPVDNSPTREALSVNSSPPGDEPVDNSPIREALSVNSSPPGDEPVDNSPIREALSVNSSPPGDEPVDNSPIREALSVNSALPVETLELPPLPTSQSAVRPDGPDPAAALGPPLELPASALDPLDLTTVGFPPRPEPPTTPWDPVPSALPSRAASATPIFEMSGLAAAEALETRHSPAREASSPLGATALASRPLAASAAPPPFEMSAAAATPPPFELSLVATPLPFELPSSAAAAAPPPFEMSSSAAAPPLFEMSSAAAAPPPFQTSSSAADAPPRLEALVFKTRQRLEHPNFKTERPDGQMSSSAPPPFEMSSAAAAPPPFEMSSSAVVAPPPFEFSTLRPGGQMSSVSAAAPPFAVASSPPAPPPFETSSSAVAPPPFEMARRPQDAAWRPKAGAPLETSGEQSAGLPSWESLSAAAEPWPATSDLLPSPPLSSVVMPPPSAAPAGAPASSWSTGSEPSIPPLDELSWSVDDDTAPTAHPVPLPSTLQTSPAPGPAVGGGPDPLQAAPNAADAKVTATMVMRLDPAEQKRLLALLLAQTDLSVEELQAAKADADKKRGG